MIKVEGARVHNLKNVDCQLPRHSLTVVTGLSGSGKSSLAFDTIFAEGQRRYIETFSAYARNFMGNRERPDVDKITGLSPVISIDQKTTNKNPRSTVGTTTEIYDFLRLLYARAGEAFSYETGEPMVRYTEEQITDFIMRDYAGRRILLLAPLVKNRKGHYRELFETIAKRGFIRARVDGELVDVVPGMKLDRYRMHSIEVVIDRLSVKPTDEHRLRQSVKTAMRQGDGLMMVLDADTGEARHMSRRLMCPTTGIAYRDPAPHNFSFNSPQGWCPECEGLGCEACGGHRLNREALHFRIAGKNIAELSAMDMAELHAFLTTCHASLNTRQQKIAPEILKELLARLKFLLDVGLDYLSLGRPSSSLSGGESQRIRLATQIGSGLVNVLYILDEPSIGLHQRDNLRLIASLKELRDMGNTVIVVEHDEEMMQHADHIIDIGPGAGRHGGEVVYQGSYHNMLRTDTLTAQYLSRRRTIEPPKKRRKGNGKNLIIRGCTGNNLQNVTASFPLGTLICITGVSGSGKSSLIQGTLQPALARHYHRALATPLPYERIDGLEHADKVVSIDQSPLGRTPRSNPATYTGVWDDIRTLFAELPEAKIRGYKPGRFSFNVSGGRCETCKGGGQQVIEMNFLPDVYATCPQCRGRRFNRETLEVRFKGKSIGDILDMTINQAVDFFEHQPHILQKVKTLQDVGLGYLKLGQPCTTISGGESQRVKLSAELARKDTGKTIYILDEPTTGLHFEDIRVLLGVLQRLVDKGNTIIIIEHNLDVIRTADHLIELGPEGGRGGGQLLFAGTPEKMRKAQVGHTSKYL